MFVLVTSQVDYIIYEDKRRPKVQIKATTMQFGKNVVNFANNFPNFARVMTYFLIFLTLYLS